MNEDLNKLTNKPSVRSIDKLFKSLHDDPNDKASNQGSIKKSKKKKRSKKSGKNQSKLTAKKIDTMTNQPDKHEVVQPAPNVMNKPNVKKEIKPEKKEEKIAKLLTIGSNKSAQTQFKTALRNHIDLSAIADNKANIMLTVNALIITVALPLLVGQIRDNQDLLIPSMILAAGSLISMFYATIATRPGATKGRTTIAEIDAKKSNLFFYGNFYNMTFEEYEEGIRRVVADNEILDNSITRDLFYLGQTMGIKFRNMRWCYNIFMYSIIASVVSFIIVSIL